MGSEPLMNSWELGAALFAAWLFGVAFGLLLVNALMGLRWLGMKK